MTRYGELVLEGVELAAGTRLDAKGPGQSTWTSWTTAGPGASDGGRTGAGGRGAVAVIGPILPGTAEAAARARSNPSSS